MKLIKRTTAVFLSAALIFSTVPMNTQAAMKINKSSVTLEKGKSTTLKVKGSKNKIKWSSSKKTVATVDKNGKVVAKAPGKATIKAKTGGVIFKCDVTVKAPEKKTNKEETKVDNTADIQASFDKVANMIKENGRTYGSSDTILLLYEKNDIAWSMAYLVSNSGEENIGLVCSYDEQTTILYFTVNKIKDGKIYVYFTADDGSMHIKAHSYLPITYDPASSDAPYMTVDSQNLFSSLTTHMNIVDTTVQEQIIIGYVGWYILLLDYGNGDVSFNDLGLTNFSQEQ